MVKRFFRIICILLVMGLLPLQSFAVEELPEDELPPPDEDELPEVGVTRPLGMLYPKTV